MQLNKYIREFKISGHWIFQREVKGSWSHAASKIHFNMKENKPIDCKQMPHFFFKKKSNFEQQNIKSAAVVFAPAGRIIDWHSQEEFPVRRSPRGRGTQLHFQTEVYIYIYFFFLHVPVGIESEGGKMTRKISPFRSIFASRRPGLSALGSAGAAAAFSTVRCHSAHYFKSRERDLQNLLGSIKKLLSVPTTFLVTFKKPARAPLLFADTTKKK